MQRLARLALIVLVWCAQPLARADEPEPGSVKKRRLEAIEQLVDEAIARKELPGCVVGIGTHAGPLYTRAFGVRTQGEPMTEDTLFDLASLTKPMVSAASIALLVERGLLALDHPVSRYLREFDRPDKRAITIAQLLLHTSGLPAVGPLDQVAHGRPRARASIAALPLRSAPGSSFEYSDLGYIVLGELVALVGAHPLEQLASESLFAPLGLVDTHFFVAAGDLPRTAPTELREEQLIRGVVDDPRAYRLGGVAGHAGLFSTASDVARFAQLLLRGGELARKRVFTPETIRTFTEPRQAGRATRTLGWDVRSPYSLGRGTLLSDRAYGHGGYTGTSLWIDPTNDLYVVVLSNRVHAGPHGTIHPLASSIADLALRALAPVATGVRAGIDVLRAEQFARLRGRRIALLTHLAARDAEGVSSLERLTHAPDSSVVSILTPEHGLSGKQEGKVGGQRRGKLAVHSLFGKTRRPSAAMLAGADTIVIDVVDVGARFYTYMATVLETLTMAAELDLPVFVLDRPNPIDGVHVEGPISEPSYASFVNYHPLPLRHGMTVGELARFLVAARGLRTRLRVVALEGWRRAALGGASAPRWDAPSPNLGSLEQALLYPAVALVEGTNVSVGRGTTRAFRVLGAPFIDGPRLAEALRRQAPAGIEVRATEFRPSVGPHRGLLLSGIELEVVDRAKYRAARTGLALIRALASSTPGFRQARLDRMVAHASTLTLLAGTTPLAAIEASWSGELDSFARERRRALLY